MSLATPMNTPPTPNMDTPARDDFTLIDMPDISTLFPLDTTIEGTPPTPTMGAISFLYYCSSFRHLSACFETVVCKEYALVGYCLLLLVYSLPA
jgi:hypothetical protein